MVANTAAGESYSPFVAYIYIFNLIVGVGALALPIGFKSAGLILGIIFLAILGFLAYVTVTWVNEVQAAANALITIKETKPLRQSTEDTSPSVGNIQGIEIDKISENSPLIERGEQLDEHLFDIKRRVEFGLMSEIFLGPIGQKLFYLILVVYLYGDLAIYAVSIPTSLTAVTGGWCARGFCISSHNVYYLYLAMFVVLIVPWAFFNFQKTKPLQMVTLFTRQLAFWTMIILGLVYIGQGHGAKPTDLPWFRITGLPSLFGVSIYAFMCHHSLPSLVSPIRNKNYMNSVLGLDFITIFLVYSLLCASALFAFGDTTNKHCSNTPGEPCQLQSLYTLNFTSYHVRVIAEFLALYPVFTLSTNFPLIAITLRNNLMLLIPIGERHPFWGRPLVRQIVFALIATIPPVCIAFGTRDVDTLVSVTGSYAGLGIMFVIPAFLLVLSRKKIKEMGEKVGRPLVNPHTSKFGHIAFVGVIGAASLLSLGMTTFNLIYKGIKHQL